MSEKRDLLFFEAYEKFYLMAEKSDCFRNYCKAAFGEDFSQDGFSDVQQIDFILQYISITKEDHLLDIGCGNGKMLKYLQSKTGAHISGFDFSKNAIHTASSVPTLRSDFRVGVIGKIEYPSHSFDLIISMDSIYFAKDMKAFVGQAGKWLKENGTFFIAYQEGDIMPKTTNNETTKLAQALKANHFEYEVFNFTRETYDMLLHKRKTILEFKEAFVEEHLQDWFEVEINQTNCVTVPFEQYARENARYIFIAKLP